MKCQSIDISSDKSLEVDFPNIFVILICLQLYLKDEMDRVCSTHGREVRTNVLWEELKGGDHQEHLL
jgi:hypothetical protein